MSRFGLDYTGHVSAAAHRAAGSSFACRYLSGGLSKDLDPGEAQGLRAGGVDVLVVWETTATRWMQGEGAGAIDARAALAEANHLGLPAHRPIYFAVDYDEAPWQTPEMDAYFRGVVSVLGVGRTGVYGDFYVCERLVAAGLVRYCWQTYAWSGGQVSKHANVLQYSNDHVVGGIGVDFNRALKADFGQWGFRPAAPAAPPPKPVQHASGEFNARLTYNHDAKSVHLEPLDGQVTRWGDVDEDINLEVSLRVGPTVHGAWHGKVLGATPVKR